MSELSAVRLWTELKVWCAEHLPEVVEALNPSAREEEVAKFDEELKQALGQGLPRGLQEVYLKNNGQNEDTPQGIFFGLPFLSLGEMRVQWRSWYEIAVEHADMNEDFRKFSTIYPANSIQNVYAHTHWLPFSHDSGGNHIGLDLQPGPTGQIGQIINCGRDEDYRCVMAPSFEAFLEWTLAQYRAGNYAFTEEVFDEGPRRILNIGYPPNTTHFLDAVPTIFGLRPPLSEL